MSNSCVPSELQIRLREEDSYLKICDDQKEDDYKQLLNNVNNHCQHLCLQECVEYKVEYSYDKYILNSKNKDNHFIVSITPRKCMKIKYRLVGATALQPMLADLGGIWGIWLGFNMLTLYTRICQFITNKLK